jgi:agmatinase
MFVVKVPGINGLGKTKGCERAGSAIIKALRNLYTNEQRNEIDVDKLDLEEIHLDNFNLELTNNLVYKNSFEIFETKPKTIFLGGDHSVSYSITRAFLNYCQNSGKEPCLIVFDAHPDCMKPVDENFPTHEEWLRGLIEAGFPAENILLVGIRNAWKTELDFLKTNKIKIISIDKFEEDFEETCHTIMEFANNRKLYVSLDIDVVDPVFAPSTGYPESGGLTSRQILYLIKKINKIKTLKAIDIVEINSEQDKKNTTINLGAKIVAELI